MTSMSDALAVVERVAFVVRRVVDIDLAQMIPGHDVHLWENYSTFNGRFRLILEPTPLRDVPIAWKFRYMDEWFMRESDGSYVRCVAQSREDEPLRYLATWHRVTFADPNITVGMLVSARLGSMA